MLRAAARLARAGSAAVSAAAGLLMLALLAFGGFALWQDAAVSRGAFAGAELLHYKPAVLAADNPTLTELQARNPDVCGWLTIDGTNIDYPFVQGATNMDYINRDVTGAFSLSGSVFLDSRCAAGLTDPYTLMYGHHMENGAMFGDVAAFAQADFFAAHTSGSVSLPDAAYTVELFACLCTDAYDSAVYDPARYQTGVQPLLDYLAANAVQQRPCSADAQAVQHISRPEHHRKLGQLRRLQREGTACKVDPAVGAVGILRAEQRCDEQHNGNDVEALVHIPQGAIVDV